MSISPLLTSSRVMCIIAWQSGTQFKFRMARSNERCDSHDTSPTITEVLLKCLKACKQVGLYLHVEDVTL
jgi:hypothetical protein